MKRAAFLFLAVLSACVWTACGGSSNNATQQLSNIKDRALFDNAITGGVNILDIDKNPPLIYQTTVAAFSAPQQMFLTADRGLTIIYDDSSFTLNLFNNKQETTVGTFNLNNHSEGIVLSGDGHHAYAAVPNNPEANPTPPGAVLSFDLTTGAAGLQVPVPGARRLAISGDGKTLLVFADNNDNVYYIDLSATTLKAVAIPGFNRPYAAYFASDNTTAYVLNCGLECSGGSAPSVQPLSVSSAGQTLGTAIPVPGATIGLLNGSTLTVAGNDVTQPAGSQGVFSTVDVTSGAVTSVGIQDGIHNKMVSFNNAVWVGSSKCTPTNDNGKVVAYCLYSVAGSTAKRVNTPGDVTAITPAPKKGWVYVMQGGELYQVDPSSLTFSLPYDIIGQGWDIKLLDQ